jgi:hypothetical protein
MRGILQHVTRAERWLAELADTLRRVTVVRMGCAKRRLNVTTQLEDVDPTLAPFLPGLGVTEALVYTPGT